MKKSIPFMIVQDILLTGLILCVFAFFHHVLPRLEAMDRSEPSPAPAVQTQAALSPAPETEQSPPAQAEEESWGEKFAEYFSPEIETGENFYKSPTVSVTVETVEQELDGHFQRWYVADIYIADIKCFATYAENGSFETYAATPALEIAELAGAIVSINGDYCNAQAQSGFFVRNGVAYQQDVPARCDICVLYMDGSLETYAPGEYTAEEILERQPWQIWKFGPELLDGEGQPLESFNTSSAIEAANPRSALGYYEPGHYCFLVSEGRLRDGGYGLTMAELAQIFSDLGCKRAYNLDGGDSACMVLQGKVCNTRSGQRELGDILLIKEPEVQP